MTLLTLKKVAAWLSLRVWPTPWALKTLDRLKGYFPEEVSHLHKK